MLGLSPPDPHETFDQCAVDSAACHSGPCVSAGAGEEDGAEPAGREVYLSLLVLRRWMDLRRASGLA